MLPRCRLLLSRSIKSESWLEASQVHFLRFRSNDSRQRPRNSYNPPENFLGKQRGGFKHGGGFKNGAGFKHGGRSNPQHVMKQKKRHILDGFSVRDASDTLFIMKKQVRKWAGLPHVHRRLESFGVPRTDVRPILSIFAREVSSGLLDNPIEQKKPESHSAFLLLGVGPRATRGSPEISVAEYAGTNITSILHRRYVVPCGYVSQSAFNAPQGHHARWAY